MVKRSKLVRDRLTKYKSLRNRRGVTVKREGLHFSALVLNMDSMWALDKQVCFVSRVYGLIEWTKWNTVSNLNHINFKM